jgi:carboxypeptidase PM20D1
MAGRGSVVGRLILGVVALLSVLVAVVVGRTLMIPAFKPGPAATPTGIDVDANRVAAHLGEAIRFATISYEPGFAPANAGAPFDAFRTWIETTYPHFRAATSREMIGRAMLFTWKGTNPDLAPVLLLSHMDVVPVVSGSEGNWKHPPFSGVTADGYVWGRGAIDCKGSLIAMLEAADALAAKGFKPSRTILFAFGADEELGGMEGNAKIAALLAARHIHPEWVDDEGGMVFEHLYPGLNPPLALISVAEKGSVSVTLTVRGAGGHSSIPPRQTVIGKLAAAVVRVTERPFASGVDAIMAHQLNALAPAVPLGERLMFSNLWITAPLVEYVFGKTPAGAAQLHTTIAPTIISGGVKSNVLPPEAHAVINFRVHPRDTVASVVAHVRDAVKDPSIEVTASESTEPSPVSDPDDVAFRAIAGVVRQSFPQAVVAPGLLVGGTDARHYAQISKNVFRFIPLRVNPEELEGLHGTNERERVTNLGEAVSFYVRLMQLEK